MSISTRIAAPHGAVFLVVGAFKSSALFAHTPPDALVGETLAAPESGATWAKRARDAAKEKQPGAQPDCFQIHAGLCLYDVTPNNGALCTCA